MPSGYTADLHDGKPVTFEQFVLKCSRAMGAAIMQRDESPDVEIRERTLDDHYVERVSASAIALQDAMRRPQSEWAEMQDIALTEAAAYREKYLADVQAMRERYEEMLGQVHDWTPPTAEHAGLQKFMIDQLTESISFDCTGWEPAVPERLSPDLYAQSEIARLTKAHANYVKYLAEERERIAGQNAWVRALRASLQRP
ncbi:hypothetical protein [Microbacterium sp. H6]|uniref:hypothetical protein n=1 Tax=Microbacterium sp. H6 TaxID=421122 RepID=UPI000DE3213E|nr:hypothetical protein [Microbacterium sp. H6]RBO73495.1 hypothetical protein DSP71_04890 [Microbacterium sp. H6]